MANKTVEEVWRPVEGWPYEVSSYGKVRPTKWARSNPERRELRLYPDKDGYLTCTLMYLGKKRRTKAHILVCETWHGPRPSPAHVARHLDGNEQNNFFENLAWGTQSDNRKDEAYNRPWGGTGHRAYFDPKLVSQLRAEYRNHKAERKMFGRQRARRKWLENKALELGVPYGTIVTLICANKGYHKVRRAACVAAPRTHSD